MNKKTIEWLPNGLLGRFLLKKIDILIRAVTEELGLEMIKGEEADPPFDLP